MEEKVMDKATSDRISFMTYIVPAFVDAYKMNVQDAYFYLKKYEARIMQAIAQQVSLYACSIGESALDTENGGMYINNLLKSAVNVSIAAGSIKKSINKLYKR